MNSGYIFIDHHIFPTLFAISSEEQTKGLMGQPWPPPIMSFIYLTPSYNKFWMKNTPSPLDIVFSHNGIINQIHKGSPNSIATIGEDRLSDFIVELPHGTVASCNFKLGHRIGVVTPSPAEIKKIVSQKYYEIKK